MNRSRKFSSHGHPVIATFSLGTSVQQCAIARHSYRQCDNYRSEGRRRLPDVKYRRSNGKVMSKSSRGKFQETPTLLRIQPLQRSFFPPSPPKKKGKQKHVRVMLTDVTLRPSVFVAIRKHEWGMNEVHAADFPAISVDEDARNLSPRKPRPKSRRERTELHAIPSRVQ